MTIDKQMTLFQHEQANLTHKRIQRYSQTLHSKRHLLHLVILIADEEMMNKGYLLCYITIQIPGQVRILRILEDRRNGNVSDKVQ